tara:strand:+ start:498 stop:665 length:168 start_codon:yes stop_codon:yes gene_type:complete
MAHEASHSAGERKRPRGMKPISKKAMATHRAKQKAYMVKAAKKFGNMLSFGQPFK